MTIPRLRSPWRHSIRTQLIVNNIVALAVLLCAFGVIVRYTVQSTMLASVDRELDGHARRFVDAPPGMPFFGGGWRGGGARRGDGAPREAGGAERGANREPAHDAGREPNREADRDANHDSSHSSNRDPNREPNHESNHDANRRAATHWPHDQNPYRVRVFDTAGKPMEPFGDAPKTWDANALALARNTHQIVRSTVFVDGVSVRVLTRSFPADGPMSGVLQAPYALTDVDHAIGWLDRALLFLSPVALICAGVGGAFLTDRMLRRVRVLATAAERIGADDLADRLPTTGDDEFSQLAATFNGLLSRVETAFRAQERLIEMQRRFTADASHELKTPLTTIKGTASMALFAPPSEDLYRQSLLEIDRAAGAMSHLVQDLLLLARADNGHLAPSSGGDGPIELLLREVLEGAMPPRVAGNPAAPVKLQIADETLTVVGKEDELVRLFRNLIENAVRWTPPDGSVTVAASRTGGEAEMVIVTVADTGVGIAPEHLPHLGERFYRVDAARARPDGGTGLGISISRSIAEAHGGSVGFESAVGVGTTARVTLPSG